jgi:hypothetical protein
MNESVKDFIVRYVAANTRTFGGGKKSSWGNPITAALEDKPAVFAAGVEVREVVDLVFAAIKEVKLRADQVK